MNGQLPFGHYVNGANTIDITVRMTKGDDGRTLIDIQRYLMDKDHLGLPIRQDVRFDASRFDELRDAVESITRHMDQALEQGSTES
ncbi:hypothetical protein AAU61_01250 [Desulfocarbo indianensis]|nr:hypothetical protein AAU61_01250 [Desulfocarbo indianensis]